VFGVPLLFVFVYGAWAAVILATRALVRRISDELQE